MKISFLPGGDLTTASTRIRVISLHRALGALGVQSHLGWSADAAALVVQKRVDPRILNVARAFKHGGGLVIYDCDDLGDALAAWAPEPCVRAMFEIADTVTTNTEPFRQALLQQLGAPRVDLIPDIVDYFLDAPCPFSEPPLDGGALRVLWFGNRGNLHLVLKYAEAFRAIPGCRPIICTDAICRDAVLATKVFQFEPWDLATFPQLLRSCHLTFLPHDGADCDRAKSNNRMITSIGWGVPSIVSRTHAYERMADRIGFGDCVVDGPEGLARVLEHFRPVEVRRRYVESAQRIVWEHHAPAAVAGTMVRLLWRLGAAAPAMPARAAVSV